MANNPRSPSPPDPAADDGRKDMNPAEDAEKANAGMERNAEPPSLHGRVKQHAHDDLDSIQGSSDEPVIEDEP